MELSDKSAAPQIASYDQLSMVKEQDPHKTTLAIGDVDSEQQQLEDLKILRMVAEA